MRYNKCNNRNLYKVLWRTTHSLNKYFLDTCWMPGIVLGTGIIIVIIGDKIPDPELTFKRMRVTQQLIQLSRVQSTGFREVSWDMWLER